ncbi:MAG: hypothetical protein IJK22_04370 [Bacteroidales bacterium]|nr:hypothetical protein [Bacteroidales bacterium]
MPVPTEQLFSITIGGKSYDDYVFTDFVLTKELLKPNELKFAMRKKSVMKTDQDVAFSISNELLGATVKLQVKTNRRDQSENICSEELSFEGVICNLTSQRQTMSQGMLIQVTAYSPDYFLIDNPHCYSFENKTLNAIIKEAVNNPEPAHSINLHLDPKMDQEIPYVVQYNENTYQFISRLAQRYGEFFYYEDSRLVFGKVKPHPAITLHPDTDVLAYHYDLAMDHPRFAHGHHNYLEYENYYDEAAGYTEQSQHKLTDYVYAHSKDAFVKPTLQNLHASVQEDNDIDQLQESVKAQGFGARSMMMTCTLTTNRADVKLGSKITITEAADQNDGSVKITNHEELLVVRVVCRGTLNGHFENELTAIPAKAEYPPYANADVYPVTETQRAIVKDNKDPEALGRIRVQFTWQELTDENMWTPWLRIAQAHGGDDKGSYVIPEIGEEVMVGFENGNAEKPYVIGTLYHGKQRPGDGWYSDSNDIKAFRTRNGHTVEVHDVDQGGFIRIYDNGKENYILTYSTDEKLIKLESKGNIELYADNDIIMEAGNDMKIKVGNNRRLDVGNDDETTVGNDQKITVDHDQNVWIKVDQSIHIDNNQQLKVAEDQANTISGNQETRVGKKSSLKANEVVQDATQKMQLLSSTHEQKADSTMKIDGGSKIDMKAEMVKIN